jgi:purine-binding chemotaxis protein CheW
MADSNQAKNDGQPDRSGRAGKYLTFSLAGEEYGINILKIKEIIGHSPSPPSPRPPSS